MKRLFALPLIMALVVSCQKTSFEPESGIESINYTASTEVAGTKTSLDDNLNILWSLDDRVTVFDGNTINLQFKVSDESAGKTSASLEPVTTSGYTAGTELGNNIGFYPYSTATSVAKGSNGTYEISTVLPSKQIYAANSFSKGSFPMVAVTASTGDKNFAFKNICGVLKLQLTGTAKIKSISVVGNNDEHIAGSATITAKNGIAPSISMTGSEKSVSLDCGEGGVQLNASTPTAFDIVLPPIAFSTGFTATVLDTEGKIMEIKTTKSKTITRSNILKMAAVEYQGKEPEIEYVDLGLSVKWATCNIGAIRPEEFGDYYAYGETETKNYFLWSNYKWNSVEIGICLTKYNSNNNYGVNDGLHCLEDEDDVAMVKLGGTWSMPTRAQIKELCQYCTWTWTTLNGVYGYLIEGNGNSIFLPAASSNRVFTGIPAGCYRPKDFISYLTDYLYFSESIIEPQKGPRNMQEDQRYAGMSVRPVNDYGCIKASSISLIQSFLKMNVGEKTTLQASVLPANVTNLRIRWSSNNPAKVSVNETTGEITAIEATEGDVSVSANVVGTNLYASCKIAVKKPITCVDLGLPSGLLWAEYNIGATKPEAFGNYYAWGETTTKSTYTEENYKWHQDIHGEYDYWYTKYFPNGVLWSDDDVATTEWGGSWRLPTANEYHELIDKCTWTWTTVSGVEGFLVQSKTNSNSIFLPDTGVNCGYWTSSMIGYSDDVDNVAAFRLYFFTNVTQSKTAVLDADWRYFGRVCRAVKRGEK